MHFYNTKGTRRPPPPPPIILCPDLSPLSQRSPAAQGVAVNQVSLELSRSRGRRRLRCVRRERLVLSIPFLLQAADVDHKAMPQPRPDLSAASFVWCRGLCSPLRHPQLSKRKFDQRSPPWRRSEEADFRAFVTQLFPLELTGAVRGSRALQTWPPPFNVQMGSELVKIRQLFISFPWKLRRLVTAVVGCRVCGGCSDPRAGQLPGETHAPHRRRPHTSPGGPYLLGAGKNRAQLGCQVQACLQQLLPITGKWYVVVVWNRSGGWSTVAV